MSAVSRRGVLAVTPAAAFAGFGWSAAPSEALAQTSIMRLYGRYKALLREMNGYTSPPGMTTVESDRIFDERWFYPMREIEAEMLLLPSTCAADFAAKLLVISCDGESPLFCRRGDDAEIITEALQLVGGRA